MSGATSNSRRREKVRRLALLAGNLETLPLPDQAVDLAIIGSRDWPDPTTTLAELSRVSRAVLLVENSPLHPELEPSWLTDQGFRREDMSVAGHGHCPGYWKPA